MIIISYLYVIAYKELVVYRARWNIWLVNGSPSLLFFFFGLTKKDERKGRTVGVVLRLDPNLLGLCSIRIIIF